MSKFQIRPATKSEAHLRLAIFGPSGSGKTMSALRIGHGLGEKIGVIDTERGSASKYSDRWPFDVIEIGDPTIENYEEAMRTFAEADYDVLIVDGMSHAWEWLLDYVEKLGRTKYKGNKWSAWSEATPMQQGLVNAILNYPGHVIATMRSKTEWVTEADERGKSHPRRVGTAPRQREGVEYEFDLLLEMDPESNTGRFIKDRTGKFQDRIVAKPGEDLGRELAAWLADGGVPAPRDAKGASAPAPAKPAAAEPKPARAGDRTLTEDEAARLAKALVDQGVRSKGHLKFASAIVGRDLEALSDLTVSESKQVHAHAQGETVEAA